MSNRQTEMDFLKSPVKDYDEKAISGIGTGVPQPEMQKEYAKDALVIDLPKVDNTSSPKMSFFECTSQRCSRRSYIEKPLSLFELSFILWCTQGIKKIIPGYRKYTKDGKNSLRPVPDPNGLFESYIAALNVESLEQAIYRYLPLTHQLVLHDKIDRLADEVADSFNNPMQNQDYTKKAGAIFYWTSIPYRAEWRNKDRFARSIIMGMGHVSQNFYLATEALQCGCVVISGYIQEKADALLGIDGEKELTILCGAVGHVDKDKRNIYANLPDLRFDVKEINKEDVQTR